MSQMVGVSHWSDGPSAQEHVLVAVSLGLHKTPVISLGVDLRSDAGAIHYLLPLLERSRAIFQIHFPDREGKPYEACLRHDWRAACKDSLLDETICGRTLGECLFRTAQSLLLAGWSVAS